ncbi:hypothetical protein KIL84_023501 [Mauremys mutica]|uniref:Uncharacterized protein n=1 Tax=Mauremys mutica TaxID=74926 RepID=A0A9D4ALZ3_9SAUR|nr:hypothetical protein KIL84_023501 [Mauremys mutica]
MDSPVEFPCHVGKGTAVRAHCGLGEEMEGKNQQHGTSQWASPVSATTLAHVPRRMGISVSVPQLPEAIGIYPLSNKNKPGEVKERKGFCWNAAHYMKFMALKGSWV